MNTNGSTPFKDVEVGTEISVPVVDDSDELTGGAVTLRWDGSLWQVIKRWKINE